MLGYELSWIYVLAFVLAGVGFVAMMLMMASMVASKRATKEKLKTYESGEEPVGTAWGRYPTHFYIFALLFVVFDVEVVFLFPWAVIFRDLGWRGIAEIGIFLGILSVGLVYFPLIDMGRVDRVLELVQFGRWQSPLMWDIFAITTYLTGSTL